MEVGYVGHQDVTLQPINLDSNVDHHAKISSVSMTATMDILGNLILGKSPIIFSYHFLLYKFCKCSPFDYNFIGHRKQPTVCWIQHRNK